MILLKFYQFFFSPIGHGEFWSNGEIKRIYLCLVSGVA